MFLQCSATRTTKSSGYFRIAHAQFCAIIKLLNFTSTLTSTRVMRSDPPDSSRAALCMEGMFTGIRSCSRFWQCSQLRSGQLRLCWAQLGWWWPLTRFWPANKTAWMVHKMNKHLLSNMVVEIFRWGRTKVIYWEQFAGETTQWNKTMPVPEQGVLTCTTLTLAFRWVPQKVCFVFWELLTACLFCMDLYL